VSSIESRADENSNRLNIGTSRDSTEGTVESSLNEAPEDAFDNWYASFVNSNRFPDEWRPVIKDMCHLGYMAGFFKAIAVYEASERDGQPG